MIPAPVWKSSYRLIFGASGAAHARRLGHRGQHHRRGLDQRQLSLVSGRPISFVSQLYAPRYVERPAAELADDRGGAAGGA